ncbi:hypothetical protein O181_013530 [Austropuccinia psidii MF-1]|uniref:Uncharacterized protein n=1 Tax=Austropuccinia psidii MF-1 TaxID=1389203 RepID=A0A9Q3GP08_9BASI|nr:hypothetical protein [Austropuccinia psidii MF-1]
MSFINYFVIILTFVGTSKLMEERLPTLGEICPHCHKPVSELVESDVTCREMHPCFRCNQHKRCDRKCYLYICDANCINSRIPLCVASQARLCRECEQRRHFWLQLKLPPPSESPASSPENLPVFNLSKPRI